MMTKIRILIVFLVLLAGCTSIPENKGKIQYSTLKNIAEKRLQYGGQLKLDTLLIDGDKVSLVGDFTIYNDTLYFADQILASFVLFDKEGKYINTRLKKGRGPGELLGLNKVTFLPDGIKVVMDQNWNISLWDQDWNKVKNIQLSFQSEKSIGKLKSCPDPNDIGVYEVEYAKNRIRPCPAKSLLFPVTVEAEKMNAFFGEGANHFYENAYTLAMISLQTGKIEHLLCNRSSVYEKYNYLPNFRNVLFDVYQNRLYYSFEIDPMIYEMDLKNISTVVFGEKGKRMRTDYRETQSLEDAESYIREDRENYGYYRYINYVPEKKLLFRGYRKGKSPLKDGLQVYSGSCLVGEFDVPRDFEVFGYIEPWYYARGTNDYENEKITLYRFKLEDND